MAGAFVILQFDDPGASDVVYVESGSGDLFMESETDVARFTAIFEHCAPWRSCPKPRCRSS